MMEIMRSVKLFSSRERRRRMSDSVMTGAEMLRSMASVTVQRPSPESGTQASRPASVGFLSSASAVRSSSQERTTEPFCQMWAIWGRSRWSGSLAFDDGEAFGVGLHHAVLDAVVDHLDEVAGAGWADVSPALVLRRGEGFEDGGEALDGSLVAADHEASSPL